MRHPAARFVIALGVLAVLASLGTPQIAAQPISEEEPPPATPAPEREIKEVTEAQDRFKKRDFDGALSMLKDAAAKHSDLPPAEVVMARWFASLQQGIGNTRARYYLDLAVAENRGDPQAYALLGGIALRERRVTDAELLYAKAHELLAAFDNADRKKLLEPNIYAGLAEVAAARADWPTAQKHFETLLQLDPKNTAAMRSLAVALFEQKKASAAKDKLKEAYDANIERLEADGEANPDSVHWAAQMAIFYERSGDREQAKKWMDYALKVAPKSLTTWLAAAQWSLDTSQIDQAEKQATAAMQIDPASFNAQLVRGVIALFKKNYKEAERYFEAAHLKSPSSFAASNNLALALCEQDDSEKKNRALQYANNNARQFSDTRHRWYSEALSTLGWVLYKLGKLQEADKVLSQLARSGRISEDTSYYFAVVSAERNRTDEAKTLLENAIRSKRPFSKREDAEALLRELNK